jgi:hypothetical protein
MKTPCNFFSDNKTYFLINFVFLFCVFFTTLGQTNKNTEKEREEELQDSINRRLRHELLKPNWEKYKAMGNYVFSGAANLYQYKPIEISLMQLDNSSNKSEKLKAIRKVRQYLYEEKIVKFVTKKSLVWLKGLYYDVEVDSLGLRIDLDKEIFLIDLNSDGIKELLFYPNFDAGLEGKYLVMWEYNKETDDYSFVASFWADIIEALSVNKKTKKAFLKYFMHGFGEGYSNLIYEYEIFSINNKISFTQLNAYVFSIYHHFFPKKLLNPKPTILSYTSPIYSKPVIRDSKVPRGEFEYSTVELKFFYTYYMGEIPKGTTITELGTYINSKGEKWRFVVLEKGYKPEILISFSNFEKDYQIYAWLPPEKYDRE